MIIIIKDYTMKIDVVLEALRQAIQDAEEFGLVRTEKGQVVTGAIFTSSGVVLTE